MSEAEEVPIYIRPHAKQSSLTYYWDAPSTTLQSLSTFNLETDAGTVELDAGARFYTFDNLTRGTKYAGGIFQINASEVSSIKSNYRTVMPGYKPGAPQNVSYTPVTTTQVRVDWEPADSNGDAEIYWHMVRDAVNSNMRLPARGYQRSLVTPSLSSGTHQLYVQAINDPGYGIKAYTSSFTIPFVGRLYNFVHWETFSGNPNYTYRIFNTALAQWSGTTLFGYDTTYTLAITPVKTSELYTFGFNRFGIMNLVFVGYTGTIQRTLSFPSSSYSIGRGQKFTVALYLESGVWKMANYDYDADTVRTSTLVYTSGSFIHTTQSYRNYVYVVFYNGNTGEYDHHVINAADSSPYFLFSTGTYSWKAAESGYISVAAQTNTGYYTTFKQARPDRTTRSHTFTETLYNQITALNQFGIDNVMTECLLSTGARRDALVFDGRTSAAPAIVTSIGNNYTITKYASETDKTGKSNNYVLGIFSPSMNNINDGGGDMYDAGNFVYVDATSESTPFSVSQGNYGTLVDNSSYGYFISAAGTWPQTTVAKITSGSAKLRVSGDTGSDGGGTVQNYDGTYTCANGRTGSYWMNVNYNAGDPTIGDLWFTIELPAWGTASITKTADTRKTSDQNNYDHFITVSGSNFLFVKMLLSKTSGQFIQSSDVQAFLESYVQAADLGATFNTVSLTNLYSWHMTNASAIYATMPSYYNYNYDGGSGSARFFENYNYSILLDGQASFTSTSFVGGDVALSTAMLNTDGAAIPWNDGTNYRLRIVKTSGITNTTLRNSIAGYTSNPFTMVPIDNVFFHYIYNSSTGRYDWYIVNSVTNTLISNGSANNNDYVASGFRAIFRSGVNLFSYAINGMTININENGAVVKNTAFDDGTNVLIFYRSDTNADNIGLLIGNGSFVRQTINKNPASSVVRSVSETGILFGFNSPFSLRVVYPDSTYAYDDTDNAITYDSSVLKTDQAWALRVLNTSTGLKGWITFALDRGVFTKDMATQAYSGAEGVQTNYLYA